MSAFLVSKNHIDTLVSAAVQYGLFAVVGRESQYGQLLVDANQKSVNAADNEKTKAARYTFTAVPVPAPVAVLKAVQCYEYQAGDFDGYEETEAAKLCASLTAKAVTKLPGYDDAPWGL